MPSHTERLDQGLVNSADPSTLEAGELQRADDAYYAMDDPAIRKVTGRVRFASSVGGIIYGLNHIEFDDGNGIVIARTPTTYYESNDGTSGSFNAITTSDPATLSPVNKHVMAVHHSNKFFLLDGENTNQVATKTNMSDNATGSRTLRRHGMKAVTQAPKVAQIAGGGWHDGLETGYYWYWVTEYDDDNDLESDFTGDSLAVELTSTSNHIRVYLSQGLKNTNTTHFKIYRAGPTEYNREVDRKALTDGELVATVDIRVVDDDYYDDGSTEKTTGQFPEYTGIHNGGWDTSAGDATSDDGNYMTTTVDGRKQDFMKFDFTAQDDNVVGILVEVEAKATGSSFPDCGLRLHLSWNNGASYTEMRTISFRGRAAGAASDYVYEAGGPTDTWGRSWSSTDFSNPNFVLLLRSEITSGSPTIYVDYVKVTLYYHGEVRPTELITFPAVALKVAGITSVIGRHGEPPVSQFGCVFEDSLVVNDVSDRSIFRYSWPGLPESFPSLYYVNMETRDADEVTCLISRQDMMIVGMKQHIVRVNYLPISSDVEFSRGRAWMIVSSQAGIVGPRAACLMQMQGYPLLIAFVDREQGLMATDGARVFSLTDGIDWQGMVETSSNVMKLCSLVNYPRWGALVLYYAEKGQGTINKRLIFHYHPSHIRRGGKLKVTGPCNLPDGGTACQMRLDSGIRHLYGDLQGNVWLEDEGYSDAAGGSILMRVKTRELHLGGFGGEFKAERVYLHHRSHAASGAGALGMIVEITGTEQEPKETTLDWSPAVSRGFTKFDLLTRAEGMALDFGAIDDGSWVRFDHVTIAGKAMGLEQ